MSGWYVKRDDKKYGPYTSTQLVEMAKKGQVLPLDWVAKGEAGQWMPASQVKGLFAAPVGRTPPVSTPAATPQPTNAFAFDSESQPVQDAEVATTGRDRKKRTAKPSMLHFNKTILAAIACVLILGIGGIWYMVSGGKGKSNDAGRGSGGKGVEALWAKAVRVSGAETPKWEGNKSPIPGSRDDFLAAMEVMGGLRGHTFQEKGVTKVQMVFQCDEQKWHEVFRKPEMLSDGYDSFIRQKYQRWRHKLSDGPLTLTGNIFVYQGKTHYKSMQAWFD
jgi:hypothetical protein